MPPEKLELWQPDPVECIKELLDKSALHDSPTYAPEYMYTDKAGKNCKYDQMWIADWWWDT